MCNMIEVRGWVSFVFLFQLSEALWGQNSRWSISYYIYHVNVDETQRWKGSTCWPYFFHLDFKQFTWCLVLCLQRVSTKTLPKLFVVVLSYTNSILCIPNECISSKLKKVTYFSVLLHIQNCQRVVFKVVWQKLTSPGIFPVPMSWSGISIDRYLYMNMQHYSESFPISTVALKIQNIKWFKHFLDVTEIYTFRQTFWQPELS